MAVPPVPFCTFERVDVGTILAIAAGWECLYQLAKRATSSSPHDKVATLGASYLIACVNAFACSVGGCWAVVSLLATDHRDRLVMTSAESPYWPGGPTGEIVERFAYSFLGWLFFDVFHLVLWYPKLGRIDMLAHHIGFICLTCLGVSHRRRFRAEPCPGRQRPCTVRHPAQKPRESPCRTSRPVRPQPEAPSPPTGTA